MMLHCESFLFLEVGARNVKRRRRGRHEEDLLKRRTREDKYR